MTDVSIRIHGLKQLQRKLGSLQKTDRALREPMARSLAHLQTKIAEYPDKPPQSTYIRSGKLGASWTTKISNIGQGIRGTLGNVREYAPYVQDEDRQAWFHKRTGWLTVQDLVTNERTWVVREFDRVIKRLLK